MPHGVGEVADGHGPGSGEQAGAFAQSVSHHARGHLEHDHGHGVERLKGEDIEEIQAVILPEEHDDRQHHRGVDHRRIERVDDEVALVSGGGRHGDQD